jgi:hypothetical protein
MQWLIPWKAADGWLDTDALEAELRRECPDGHVLFGLQVKFIAGRQDCDDFLVSLGDGRVAIVHLTWSAETNLLYPHTEIYADLNDWAEKCMLPDSADWNA